MERRKRIGTRMVAAIAALTCAFAVLALSGCLKVVEHKIPAWEVHGEEDRCEEHLAMYAWHDAEDIAHVLRFYADGTYAEEGGPAVLPEASRGAVWQVLYSDADGYDDWNGWEREEAEKVFAYRVVMKAERVAGIEYKWVYSLDWDGADLILGGMRFIPEDLSGDQ